MRRADRRHDRELLGVRRRLGRRRHALRRRRRLDAGRHERDDRRRRPTTRTTARTRSATGRPTTPATSRSPQTATVVIDTTPPSGPVLDPGDVLSGTVTLSADASDPTIASVEFQYSEAGADDWKTIDTVTEAPFETEWDTTSVADGAYDLRFVVEDEAGNSSTSSLPSKTVDNTDPTAVVTGPADGVTLSGTITFSASASDADVGRRPGRVPGEGAGRVELQHVATLTSSSPGRRPGTRAARPTAPPSSASVSPTSPATARPRRAADDHAGQPCADRVARRAAFVRARRPPARGERLRGHRLRPLRAEHRRRRRLVGDRHRHLGAVRPRLGDDRRRRRRLRPARGRGRRIRQHARRARRGRSRSTTTRPPAT